MQSLIGLTFEANSHILGQTIIATVCIKNQLLNFGETMKEIEINGIKETIVERSDYPIEQCK